MSTERSAGRSAAGVATFELCAETPEACAAAVAGGADRIELCANLHLDGTTPPEPLMAEAVALSRVPVHVLVRPEAGSFCYQPGVFARMKEEVRRAKSMGAAGVVAGVLEADGTVALAPMGELVALAAPLPVEFHRAFDVTPDLPEALEAVVASGCGRVLTSGGAADVIAGAAVLDALVQQADGRIEVAAGGGLRVGNVALLAASWRGRHYHGSLGGIHSSPGGADDGVEALAERVRAVIAALRSSADAE